MIGPYQLRALDKLVSRFVFHNTVNVPHFSTDITAAKYLRDCFPEDLSWVGPVYKPDGMWSMKLYWGDHSVVVNDETPMLVICHAALWIEKKKDDEIRQEAQEASDILLRDASVVGVVQD